MSEKVTCGWTHGKEILTFYNFQTNFSIFSIILLVSAQYQNQDGDFNNCRIFDWSLHLLHLFLYRNSGFYQTYYPKIPFNPPLVLLIFHFCSSTGVSITIEFALPCYISFIYLLLYTYSGMVLLNLKRI